MSLFESVGVFGDFVCRVAALPVSCTQEFHSAKCRSLLDDVFGLSGRIFDLRDRSSKILHAAVSGQLDRDERRDLINARRRLFNEKPLSPRERASISKCLSSSDVKIIEALAHLLERRTALRQQLKDAFASELDLARSRLRTTIDDGSLRSGILASSESLYQAMSLYRERPNALSPGDRVKTERGILRYVTRASMKATPFSTLCSILPGRFAVDNSGTAQDMPQTSDRRSLRIEGLKRQIKAIRLNKRIYGVLRHGASCHAELRLHLDVELNPTIKREPAEFVFLSAGAGREVFQRIERNELLDLVVEMVVNERMTLSRLAERIAEHPEVESTHEEAVDFVNKLLATGLLRFFFGIPEQEAIWHDDFASLMERSGLAIGRQIANDLRRLGGVAEIYSRASAEARPPILEEAQQTIVYLMRGLNLPDEKWNGPIFFEDASANAQVTIQWTPALARVFDDLRRYVGLTRRLSQTRTDQAVLRRFFDEHYADTEAPVPLLEFYEAFHRDFQKEHLVRAAKQAAGAADPDYNVANPFGLEVVANTLAARERITRLIATTQSRNADAVEVSISLDDLLDCVNDVPDVADEHVSVGMFLDLVEPKDGSRSPRVVLNKAHYVDGFGRFFSRFLHVLPESVTQNLRATNAARSENIVAEIGGDGNFNPNLHPPLLPWAIAYPTTEAAEDNVLAVTELAVTRRKERSDALSLWHVPTGREVTPVDLGFQSRDGRPALFQLLGRFSPAGQFMLPLPDPSPRHVSGNEEPTPQVRHLPRVVLNDTIVVARQAWVVPSEVLPKRAAEGTDDEWFAQVDEWRKHHGLPEEVYLRIRQHRRSSGVEPQQPQAKAAVPPSAWRGRKNLAKPQYINFGSPILLGVLTHALKELPSFVAVFEERYPSSDQITYWNDEQHVFELLVEFDVPREILCNGRPLTEAMDSMHVAGPT
ncbi:lantibiotic dehydratase [Gemmatimonas sp.]|jgi:hypothetical protein|uniref:lantibiotic dehydratase n=1 Tax=Gemmatimonas sp. TaxID=1962908 RepID=UPI0025C4DB4B|nr:lantibiotic dehydratase [Gemmatimonas sp.]MCA2982123.1 lantibiotic dehydratase [Gemmatimonas sp.]MCA2986681.1 lantibiotic dehydratase [Gemmatimonas sp.]MCA2993857.1 lantibiotic dehydratase [Gemmatimonas sp.]